MTSESNPYSPTSIQHDKPSTPLVTAPQSTWIRNGKALVVVVSFYTLLLALSAAARIGLYLELVVLLFVASFIGATWANFQLGPKIGWDRGGIPVVILLVFVAAVAYAFLSIYAGGIVYRWIHPAGLGFTVP